MTAEQNKSPPHVYKAIAEITAEMAKEGISKGRKNQQQGYAFRGIDDVYSALSSKLAAHNLCILPRVTHREITERTNKKETVLFYTVLTVEFDFVSAVDGTQHTVCTVGEAMDSGDKSTNKAMSAAYKYACLQAFCIPTEGDNDADETTHEIAPRPPIVPIDGNEWIGITKAIQGAKTADELSIAKDKARAAWARMNKEQRDFITSETAKADERLKVAA